MYVHTHIHIYTSCQFYFKTFTHMQHFYKYTNSTCIYTCTKHSQMHMHIYINIYIHMNIHIRILHTCTHTCTIIFLFLYLFLCSNVYIYWHTFRNCLFITGYSDHDEHFWLLQLRRARWHEGWTRPQHWNGSSDDWLEQASCNCSCPGVATSISNME